jgi:hypothetical protein
MNDNLAAPTALLMLFYFTYNNAPEKSYNAWSCPVIILLFNLLLYFKNRSANALLESNLLQ